MTERETEQNQYATPAITNMIVCATRNLTFCKEEHTYGTVESAWRMPMISEIEREGYCCKVGTETQIKSCRVNKPPNLK
jgi:hypothetical protein